MAIVSPTLDLQGAVVSRLKADADVSSLIAGRVYDSVPVNAAFPYVSIGSSFELQDDADCQRAVEVSLRIDAWSRATGFPEVLRIAAAVRAALHDWSPNLPNTACVWVEHRRTDKLRDADGQTNHAILEFFAAIEHP